MNKKLWIVMALIGVLAVSCSQEPALEETGDGASKSVSASEQKTTVNSAEFNQRMNQLLLSTTPWPSLDRNMKLRAVETVANFYGVRENAAVTKSADFYVQKVDQSLAENGNLANLPFPDLFKILAVMEYDFYNGQNKDDLAKEVLGERLYESNKKRLTEEANQQQ